MRIISGTAKGRRLATPKGKHIRPVLDQVKEAIFNILYNIAGLDVADVFAGTGSIGLEALSRGAATAVFVDNDREALSLIRENIEKCKFGPEARIIPKHVDVALKVMQKEGLKFDIMFVDPPYQKDLVVKTLSTIAEFGLLKPDGRIITEHHPKEPIEGLPETLTISDQRKYGQTMITFLKIS